MNSVRNAAARALFAMLVSGLASTHAATFCVHAGNAVELQIALAQAAVNGDDDIIKLQGGVYSMGSSFALAYEPAAEHHNLTIEGGYGPTFGDDCGVPPTSPDATLTELSGGITHIWLATGIGDLTIRSLTFSGSFSTNAQRSPIEIGGVPTSTGNVLIENSIFKENVSTVRPAVYVMAGQGGLLIRNTLFATDVAGGGNSPIELGTQRTGSALCSEVVNSTFVDMTSTAPALYVPSACGTLFANDIFWSNQGHDVALATPASASFDSVNIGHLADLTGANVGTAFSTDPLFKPDFSLEDRSPLRDVGNAGGFTFSVGDFDVVGLPRTYNNKVDIGAFEVQDVIFADSMENLIYE